MRLQRKATERPAAQGIPAKKPVGGFRFISTFQVLMALAAYRAGEIRWRAVRTYFALHELEERRKGHARASRGHSGRRPWQPNYTLEELRRLVGGVGGEHLRNDLRALERVGLAKWAETVIGFAESPDGLRFDLAEFWTMVEDLGQKNRKVPIPRRTVRFIAGGLRKSAACTALGHVMRCCYFQRGGYSCEGSCSASWVATLFGLDERSVKTGRKHLASIGWLTVVESDGWHRQRYGARVVVNLAWSRPVTVGEGGGEPKPPPQNELSTTKPPPLLILNRELLTESKNQEPDVPPDRPTGVLNSEGTKEKLPTMKHVEANDLRDTERTLELFEDAAKRDLVKRCEGDRLKFVAAAERAISVGTSNPAGLFVRIVRAKLWHHLTQGDEDAAARRLKRHFYGDVRAEGEGGYVAHVPVRRQLSDDGKVVLAVKRVASQHRLACDPFHLLIRERPEWTRERWNAAEADFEIMRMGKFRVAGVEE